MSKTEIETQAKLLAIDNKEAEPAIERVFWFPDEREVRLVGLLASIPRSQDGKVHAYHFRPSPADGLPAPSGIALIRPDEFGKITLPATWGSWDQAVELAVEEPIK